MKILEVEKEYTDLQSFLSEASSRRTKLIRISEFFDLVLSTSNLNLIEAYISDFLPRYFTLMKLVKIRGLNPDVLVKLQDQLTKLSKFDFVQNYRQDLEDSFAILKNKYELLSSWLNGHLTNPNNNLIYFPVLEKNESKKVMGFLEIIRVGISDGESKFIIDPAESEEDDLLEIQLHLCWEVAVGYCKKYIKKIKPNHTVELKFENKLGVYVGNSFGIALTLAFIEALLKHYNSSTIVNINGCIAVTGGIDKNSKILSTGKTTIESKVETVFYSDAHIFCVPKSDEMWAEEKLKEMKLLFPERDLRIIGLADLYDLLDRRQIVDVRKQKLVVRTGKFVKKNWVSAAATVLLAILFAYLFVMDFDDNPDSYYADGNNIYVLNKNGKKIWSYNCTIAKYVYTDANALKYYIKFRDIDDDGINEIFYVDPAINNTHNKTYQSTLIGLKNLKDTLWTYIFRDSVSSEREILSNNYTLSIIDFINLDDKDLIICWAQNTTSFSNAVFLIDTKTGKRIDKTHWVSGHITGGMLLDLNHDGLEDLLLTGIDNGFEEAVIWGVEFKQLDGYRPTIPSYIIKDKEESLPIFYIRIPKLDYENFMGFRSSGIDFGSLTYLANDSLIRCGTLSYRDPSMIDRLPLMDYRLKSNLKDFNIYVSSSFRVVRDSLVAKGFLEEPYTDTREYIDLQKNKILYWKDGNWVKRNALN
ncbi:MAG TPA: hypothetical protein DHV28_01725 [Ignavibacteriales bacterium]|nr:hypothetical protein [Ignavibacteriales bacterium]